MLQKFCLLLVPLCAAAMMATGAFADDLKVGDKAPDFKLIGTDGKTYTLADLKGKTIVLAWFPKAFTGG
jgi:peroxiredoxin Q/BCP